MDKYLNATEDQLATFGSNSIKTSATAGANELVVATNIDFAPFEYYNGNKIAGIDIEIAQLIANEMGKTLVVEHMDFDAVVTSVQTKDIYDIGMAALTISEDRAEMVNFTKPYFDTTQVVVVKADDTTFDACSDKDAMLQNSLLCRERRQSAADKQARQVSNSQKVTKRLDSTALRTSISTDTILPHLRYNRCLTVTSRLSSSIRRLHKLFLKT